MKIAVITINCNNATGLEATIQSVLQQNWEPLEYIVIDGGSTDGSVAVIERYRHSLHYWISEADKGVYDAQNKGLARVSAPYVLFLNSGDKFLEETSLQYLASGTKKGNELVYGDLLVEEPSGNTWIKTYPDKLPANYFDYETLPHPASLIPTALLRQYGGYDTRLHICADWKFFRLVLMKGKTTLVHVPRPVSIFRTDGLSSREENAALIREEKNRVKTELAPRSSMLQTLKSKLFRQHKP